MSEKKLTKGDRFNMFMRTNLQQASFNYERMHALGMCFDMVPAIKRLYDTKEEKIKEDTKATIRCIPFDSYVEGDKEPGKCMVTGKPSACRVVFARSY